MEPSTVIGLFKNYYDSKITEDRLFNPISWHISEKYWISSRSDKQNHYSTFKCPLVEFQANWLAIFDKPFIEWPWRILKTWKWNIPKWNELNLTQGMFVLKANGLQSVI